MDGKRRDSKTIAVVKNKDISKARYWQRLLFVVERPSDLYIGQHV
jgi:hypothetical protein